MSTSQTDRKTVLPWTHLATRRFTSRLNLLVCQVEAKRSPADEPRIDLTLQWLQKEYPSDHPVTLLWTDGLPEYATLTRTFSLNELAKECGTEKFFASLYVPPLQRSDL